MNLRTILLVVAALSAAGFTAFFANSWIQAERAAMEAERPEVEEQPVSIAVEVLVTKKDLPTGTFLKPEDLKWQAWPEDGIAEDFVVRGEGVITDFEGAVARNHLVSGEPITASRVVHPGERGFLAAVLDPTMRAVSVPVDATTGISGFVFPGDWVDLLLTIRMNVKDPETDDAETRYFSETLLTHVRVLAIDQRVENVDGTARVAKTATLEVTPKQAERVAIALEIGTLSLSLHSIVREDQMLELPGMKTASHAEGEVNGAVVNGASARNGATVNGTAGAHDSSRPISLLPARQRAEERARRKNPRSYTLDYDVYYMLGDPRGLNAKGRGREVNVVRGSEAEKAVF